MYYFHLEGCHQCVELLSNQNFKTRFTRAYAPHIFQNFFHFCVRGDEPNIYLCLKSSFTQLQLCFLQTKKTKTKQKKDEPLKKNRKCLRSTIDLAKTALDYEIISYYSTDEENLDGSDNATKPYRQQHRADLKRAAQTLIPKVMPPELIITPAQKNGDETVREYKDEKSQVIISELPPIGRIQQSASWHNFKKCVPTVKYIKNKKFPLSL